jgi:hypothetical protein
MKFSNFTVLTTPTQMNQAARDGNYNNNDDDDDDDDDGNDEDTEEANSIYIPHTNKLIILVSEKNKS